MSSPFAPLLLTALLSFAVAGPGAGAEEATAPVSDITSQRVATTYSFPSTDGVMFLRSMRQLSVQISRLEPKIGTKPSVTDVESGKEAYRAWSSAMLSALAFRQTEGNTEEMMCALCALYRMGVNLDVAECREEVDPTVELALAMYPDSMRVQWQAVYWYMETLPDNAGKAEAALMALRRLMHSEDNFEVERRLASLYFSSGRMEEARVQVSHVLTLRPDDAEMKALRNSIERSKEVSR